MRVLIFLGFLLMMSSSEAQITIEDCQQKARQNYPLIKQFELIEKSADYTISNANKAYLPQLSITAIGGIVDGFPQFSNPGTEASSSGDLKLLSILQFNQVIWDGGNTKARKGIANLSAEVEKADIEVSLHAIEERVNNLFFGILLIDGQEEQLFLLVKNLEGNRKALKSAVDNGSAYSSDLNELDYQILSSMQRIQELNYNRKAYLEMLSALTGELISEESEFQKPIFSQVYNEFEIQRAELDLFQHQMDMLESKNNLNKSKVYPKIGLMALGTFVQPGIAFGPEDLNRILVAGLSVSWEFGSLYSRGNDRKINEVEYERIENRKETFLFSTELQLSQAKGEIEKYKALLEQDEQMQVLKTKIKESYQAKYDNGVATSSELLHRINDESAAKQNKVVHEIQYMMALYQYKTISGN